MKYLLPICLMFVSCGAFCGEEAVFSLRDAVPFGEYRLTAEKTLEFDGKTAGATLEKDALNHPDDGITVMAVVRTQKMPDNTPEDRRHDAVAFRNKQFVMGYDYDRFYVNFHNGTKWFAPLLAKVKISDAEFHSLAMTAKRIQVPSQGEDYLQVKLYFDGNLLIAENLQHATVAPSLAKLNIGHADGFGNVWHFGGEIADVTGYNRVLSLEEIQDYTAAFPAIKNQPQKSRRLSAADRIFLESLPDKGPDELLAAVSAIRNLALRTEVFDWRHAGEKLKKSNGEGLEKYGLHPYKLGETILTVAANDHYAAPVSLFDTRTKREFFCWDNPLFRLKVQDKIITPLGTELKSSFTTLPDTPDGTHRFQINWSSSEIEASVEFHCGKEKLEYFLKVVSVRPGINLETVEFPALELEALDSNAELFSPVMSGVVDSGAIRSHVNYELEYPRGIASMQYGAFYDERGGIFWSPADPKARMKKLYYEAGGNRVKVRYEWYPARNEPFEPSCPVRLKVFRGNWYDAAMIYREMLTEIEALWFPHSPLPRTDTPAWMRDNTLWFLHGGSRLDSMGPFRKVREYLGLPFAVHLYRWNSKTFDRDYPHHQSLPSFLNILDECHSMGIRVTPYINGRLWETLDRREEDYLYTKLGAPNCVVDAAGKLSMSIFNKANFAAICPYTEIYEKMMRKSCFMLEGMGADGIYVDQIGAAAHIPCYNPKHGHRIPDDTAWFEKGHHKVFSRIRAEMHSRNPETVLTTEDNAETCVGDFDGLLCWRWMYRGQVPAFPAVYSGHTQLIGLTYDQERDAEASFGKAAWQLIGGGQLGWFTREYFCAPEKHEFRVWIKQLMHLRLALLPFFNNGKMARPVSFAEPVEEKLLYWGAHGTGRVNTPAIAASAWEFDHMYAVLLLNTTDREQRNSISLLPPFKSGRLYWFDSDNQEGSNICPVSEQHSFVLPPRSFRLLLAIPETSGETRLLERIRGQFTTIAKVPMQPDPFSRKADMPLAVLDSLTGMAAVRAEQFECRFFPGCMYPIRFELPDGTPLPEIRWDDQIVINKQIYRLDCDRWAERNILVNTPEKLIVECSGTFCTQAREFAAPGEIKAIYRYTFQRNHSEVEIEAKVILPEGTSEIPQILQLQKNTIDQKISWSCDAPERKNNVFSRKGKIQIRP
jgi:hypothetical protein